MEKKAIAMKSALKRAGVFLGELLLIYVVVQILFGVLFAFVFVNGNSMLDTYHDGDAVFASRVGYQIDHGDVILFKDSNGVILIKRVIGLPGDTVQIEPASGTVFLNGEKLKEDYLGSETYIAGIALNQVALGDGEYFVMGDNRMDSRDSRFPSVGPVSKDQLVGKVLVCFGSWTFARDAVSWVRSIPSMVFGTKTP